MTVIRCLTSTVSRLLIAVPFLLLSTGLYAGVGIGTQPDYPTPLLVGETGVPVTVSFTNTSDGEQAVGVVTVFPGDIKHNPSCGTDTKPCTSPDPGIFSVSATGVGINGSGSDGPAPIPDDSVCEGINFDITGPDILTGQYTFTPNPAVPIELFRFDTCIISFTVDVLAIPTIDASLVLDGIQTVQTSIVTASHIPTDVTSSGTGADETTITDCDVSLTKCVVVDTDGDGSLIDEECLPAATSVVGALAEWRIEVENTGHGLPTDCTVTDPILGIDQSVDLSSGLASIDHPGICLSARTDNTATVNCTMCDGQGQVNTDSASATLICEDCEVEVDKQVSCDGGNTWYDVGLVMDATGDGDDPCAALGTDPIYAQYEVNNPNTACDLSNCVLSETNTTFGAEPAVLDLASGASSGLLGAQLTPSCDEACGGPDCPNEPNTITVTCDTEYGTSVTANDDGNFSCLEVALLVDRNVDCGTGPVDQLLTDADGDGPGSCTTLEGLDVNWGYEAKNDGTAPLYACVLTDTNPTVSGQIVVGGLAPGETTGPIAALNNPVPCSPELQASETPFGQVDLECCTADVGSLIDCETADRVSVYDRSSVQCEPVDLGIVKECVDDNADGADESVRITVTSNAATNEPGYYSSCTVTDTFYIDNDCASGPAGIGTDLLDVSPNGYALGSDDQAISTAILPAFTTASCNTASVTCLDPAGAPVTRNAIPVDCAPPTEGCITRTPGFWGNRPNVTENYLPLEVCGVPINNVDSDDTNSAIEAICSVGKDGKIMGPHQTQLVRQCTAAALNFAVSAEEGGNCSGAGTGDPSLELAGTVFNACCTAESTCTGVETDYSVNECIGLLDWFNNSDDTLSTDVFTRLGRAYSATCRASRNNGVVVNPTP